MSTTKDTAEEQDPDYATPGPSDTYAQQKFEENARLNTSRKITAIIEKEFSKEINEKEKEIILIQNRLQDALKKLHVLRYLIITDFYQRQQCTIQSQDTKQTRIHPAIKQLIGKTPKNHDNNSIQPSTSSTNSSTSPIKSSLNNAENHLSTTNQCTKDIINENIPEISEKTNKKREFDVRIDDERQKKIPRYVPPHSGLPEPEIPARGVRHKVRKRIICGNLSKWIPIDWREDEATHKWTVYVRGDAENPDISDYVGKVRFFLDPSYRPNDVVEVTTPPYHLSRRGWGEFCLRIQIHFKNTKNKPINVYHNLKLDKTFTGLQTFGSETVVDVWLNNFDDIEVKNDSIKIEETDKSDVKRKKLINNCYVYYEHDYVNFHRSNGEIIYARDDNITIIHSNDEISVNKNYSINGNDEKIHEKIIFPTKNGVKLQNGSVNTQLQPLKINIPPTFESLRTMKPTKVINKQIILFNDEKIVRKKENCGILPTAGVSVLKKSTNLINIKLNTTKTLLLNGESNIPALQIAHETPGASKSNGYVDLKTKTKFNVKKDEFLKVLKSIDDVKITDIEALLRFIVKRLPIITGNADDLDYQKIHPYSCSNVREFLDFHIAKQRAIEWYRARMIRQFLMKKCRVNTDIWTTKEIMLWCRVHGYTPGQFTVNLHALQLTESSKTADETFINVFSESTGQIELRQALKMNNGVRDCQDDEIIDIEGLQEIDSGWLKEELVEKRDSVWLDVDERNMGMENYVTDISQQIGIKIVDEEIVAGVRHCAAARVLVKALECFMEDLLRSSLAKAWEKSTNGSCPSTISIDDVLSVISSREEFDFLTHSGLGAQQYTED